MRPEDITDIELEQERHGKAEIVFRNAQGNALKVIKPIWHKRYEIYSSLVHKWLSHRPNTDDGKKAEI